MIQPTQYKKLNDIIGWIVFILASVVYIVTCEPTASFWDCGEYISTAYKLQVGHPPGAPLFQMVGRFFSLFAFGDTSLVAYMVNILSALASSFTILFLFWTITMLARKIVDIKEGVTKEKMIAIFGSGIVGALALTFSDTFWFSAVEGEVYAFSSFFTAVVFWAILKWESDTDDRYSWRWIILIAYLVGLSIGVHLLCLLAIPAMTFVYYFKNYEHTRKRGIITFFSSLVLLVLVQNIIIPQTVSLAGKFELFFVNNIGMPFNSGTIIYFLLLIGGIVYGLYYTRKKNKPLANTIILCFTFILIGYSSFLMLVIRSNANTPIDENNPEDAISLLAYLNREQYGDWPLLHGNYYNSPTDLKEPTINGGDVYTKDENKGRYVVSDQRTIPNYDDDFCTPFPRMWSTQGNHISGYKNWGKIKGDRIKRRKPNGEMEVITKPTFGENLRFMRRFQMGHLYFRYFMWNFAGRQNDMMNMDGNILRGNWISGIGWIDKMRLGPQDDLPSLYSDNKGRNKLYFLPLILGLIGIFYQAKKDFNSLFVVGILFIITGITINIYLNPPAPQPRERDYAYVGSFYTFAIWIGLGVLAIYEGLKKKLPGGPSAVVASVLCLLLVPGVMVRAEWDDHDRSGRRTALDFACNYLNSCEKNAIIFTNGDNDTFPLWYAQEVEGIRTDVRVCNLSLLNTDWYIDQMKRKAYESEAIPFSMEKNQYRQGTRDYVFLVDVDRYKNKYNDLKRMMEFVASDNPATKVNSQNGPMDYIPCKMFSLPVDSAKVIENGVVPVSKADRILPSIQWKLNKNGVMKSHLMVLDLLAQNDWDRPIYFAITTGDDSYLGLQGHFQLEGLAYRFVPYKTKSIDGQNGEVAIEIMYDNLMNRYKWGNIQDPDVYLNEDNVRMTMNLRNNFARLANALIGQGKKDTALKVLDRCMEVMPEETVPYNYFTLAIAEAYFRAGGTEKAIEITDKLIDQYAHELSYFTGFSSKFAGAVKYNREQAMAVMQRVGYVARMHQQPEMQKRVEDILVQYQGGLQRQ